MAEEGYHGWGQLPVLWGLTSACLIIICGFHGYLTNILTHTQPYWQYSFSV